MHSYSCGGTLVVVVIVVIAMAIVDSVRIFRLVQTQYGVGVRKSQPGQEHVKPASDGKGEASREESERLDGDVLKRFGKDRGDGDGDHDRTSQRQRERQVSMPQSALRAVAKDHGRSQARGHPRREGHPKCIHLFGRSRDHHGVVAKAAHTLTSSERERLQQRKECSSSQQLLLGCGFSGAAKGAVERQWDNGKRAKRAFDRKEYCEINENDGADDLEKPRSIVNLNIISCTPTKSTFSSTISSYSERAKPLKSDELSRLSVPPVWDRMVIACSLAS